MAPSATNDTIDAAIAAKMPPPREFAPAKIFPMKENRFEKPVPIQSDGREKARTRDDAVIVIDNGQSP
jgi:actin-related protein 5